MAELHKQIIEEAMRRDRAADTAQKKQNRRKLRLAEMIADELVRVPFEQIEPPRMGTPETLTPGAYNKARRHILETLPKKEEHQRQVEVGRRWAREVVRNPYADPQFGMGFLYNQLSGLPVNDPLLRYISSVTPPPPGGRATERSDAIDFLMRARENLRNLFPAI